MLGIVLIFVNVDIYFNAFSWLNILSSLWIDDINKSTYVSYLSISRRQYLIISLSDSIPNALITINNGIGFFTFGISTTICPFLCFDVGATIFTETVLIGFDASSDTDLIAALWLYNSLPLSFT